MIAAGRLEDVYEDLKRSIERSFTTFFGRLRYRRSFVSFCRT